MSLRAACEARISCTEAADVPEAVVDRDIPGVCWLIVERVLAERSGDGRGAAVAVSALRILVGLPPSGLTADEARAESFLRGKIMHASRPGRPKSGSWPPASTTRRQSRSSAAGSYGNEMTVTLTSHSLSASLLETRLSRPFSSAMRIDSAPMSFSGSRTNWIMRPSARKPWTVT